MFPARNRLIAGLAATTVVVEAGQRSGALVTARVAHELGRPVGAVPGRVTSPHAAGPHGLLAAGAHLVRGPQDVLDGLFGAGIRTVGRDARPELSPQQRRLLAAIEDAPDTPDALAQAGLDPRPGLAAVARPGPPRLRRGGPGGRPRGRPVCPARASLWAG